MGALFGLLLGLVGLPAAAQDTFVEGKDYTVLESRAPVTAPPDKIEVAYFFLARCVHCFALEPRYQMWAAKQPEDVDVQRVHVAWPGVEPFARGYYAALELGVADRMLWLIYDLVHVQDAWAVTEEQWVDLFARVGVAAEDAMRVLKSKTVDDHLLEAQARNASYNVRGVPYLVVDGRYGISPSNNSADAQARILVIADFLIAKVREERGGG